MKDNNNILDITDIVTDAPNDPGVYIFIDANETPLYIGKAKKLKNRLRNYLNSNHVRPKIKSMLKKASNVKTIMLNSEAEALRVEYDLIKEHKPPFNSLHTDDKSRPYIKITHNSNYPEVSVTRTRDDPDADYFGPYHRQSTLNDLLDVIETIFPYVMRGDERGSKSSFSDPDNDPISVTDYQEQIKQFISFLRGNFTPIRNSLENKIDKASKKRKFRAASVYQDRLETLNQFAKDQPFIKHTKEADVFGIATKESAVAITVFTIRYNRMINQHTFTISNNNQTKQEILEEALVRFYGPRTQQPKTILTNIEINKNRKRVIQDKLFENKTPTVKKPKQGEKNTLVKNAVKTAQNEATEVYVTNEKKQGRLRTIKNQLKLKNPPRSVEGFDISNEGDNIIVGASVRFVNLSSEKSSYRHFRINQSKQDDTKAMRTLVKRRLAQLRNEKYPDMILIDGGVPQITAVRSVLEHIESDLPIFGLAKENEVLYNQNGSPLSLTTNDEAVRFCMQIRDEAHRFAVSYVRDRRQNMLTSNLQSVKGVGKKRAQKIIKKFGSSRKAQQASVNELIKIPGITEKIAKKIKNRL